MSGQNKPKESTIETYFKDRAKRRCGLTRKFTSPGNSGVMDQILIMPMNRVYFVELKRPDGKLRDLQDWQADQFRKVGAVVLCLDTIEKIDAFFDALSIMDNI